MYTHSTCKVHCWDNVTPLVRDMVFFLLLCKYDVYYKSSFSIFLYVEERLTFLPNVFIQWQSFINLMGFRMNLKISSIFKNSLKSY